MQKLEESTKSMYNMTSKWKLAVLFLWMSGRVGATKHENQACVKTSRPGPRPQDCTKFECEVRVFLTISSAQKLDILELANFF